MAKLSLTGSGDASDIAAFLSDEMQKDGMSCELVDSVTRSSGTSSIHIMVFEKFFWRASNWASLTVVVSGENSRVCVDAIGSGGGQGMVFKMSWGAEEDFAYAVERILKPYGFVRDV